VTLNRQESYPNTRTLGGQDRGTDIRDLPLGVFRLCRNLLTSSQLGKAITRDGYLALSERLYPEPFAILPGAAGGRTVTIPEFKDPLPSSDMSLKLVAVPNTGLFANAGNPQTVTFIVYPALESGVTIATYNWDFSYDGVSRNTDSSGSATSQDNEYTAAGTYKIQVWGTGSDGKEYNATVQITINVFDSTAPAPEPLPDPPIEESGGDGEGDGIDDKLPPTIELTANPSTIASGDTSQLSYTAQRADTLYLYKSTDTDFEQSLPVSSGQTTQGTIEVDPTATTVYSITAENPYGFPTGYATVTVGTPEDPIPGWLLIVPNLPTTEVDSVTYYLVDELTNFTVAVHCLEDGTSNAAAFPVGYDPVLSISDLIPLGTSLNVISPTFNAERTIATFALQQLDLDSGVTSGIVKLTASLPDVTPSVSADSVNVWAIAPSATLTTDCVDVDGIGISEAETELFGTPDSGGYVTQTIYLKIEADPNTFENNVQITWDYVSGWPTDAAEITVEFQGASGFEAYSDATNTTLITAGLIPGALFLANDAGFVSVAVTVEFPATQGYHTSKELSLSFDATEVASE